MIDTHTHLYLSEFDDEGATTLVDRAADAGISKLVMPNVDLNTVAPLLSIRDKRPEVVFIALGLHPTEVNTDWLAMTITVLQHTNEENVVGIGEIGMDLYWDKTFRDEQMAALEYQINFALHSELPVIIHCREALDETLEVISGFKGKMPQLIFHSFTGSRADVDKIRRITDPFFGINGVVTFKNAKSLHEAIPHITLDRMVLETDSPYLAPVPKRGKRNESSYLPFINSKIAELLMIDPIEVEFLTDRNAKDIFHI